MDITATVYAAYTGHETFDIGRDEGLPVNEEYADRVNLNLPRGNCTRSCSTSRIPMNRKWMPPSTALSTRLIIHLKKAARAVAAIFGGLTLAGLIPVALAGVYHQASTAGHMMWYS
jgi:hypothetical protein